MRHFKRTMCRARIPFFSIKEQVTVILSSIFKFSNNPDVFTKVRAQTDGQTDTGDTNRGHVEFSTIRIHVHRLSNITSPKIVNKSGLVCAVSSGEFLLL